MGAPWEQDSVEFLIDENADVSPGYGADDCQYRVNFRGQTTGGENFDNKNIRAAVRETEFGYQVEAAVSWRSKRERQAERSLPIFRSMTIPVTANVTRS